VSLGYGIKRASVNDKNTSNGNKKSGLKTRKRKKEKEKRAISPLKPHLGPEWEY
jgi:hypothetical protein